MASLAKNLPKIAILLSLAIIHTDADDNVEDVFIGIDEVVDNFPEQTEYQGGLYVLGTVPADGEIQMVSFCGILNNSTLNEINITGNLTGRVRIFVLRGRQLVNSSVLRGRQREGAIYCGEFLNVSRAVKASDKILIYIGRTCSLTNDGNTTLCPLQVNIDSQQNITTEFYNGSDIINQRVRSIVRQSVRNLPLVNISMELNVRVKIRATPDTPTAAAPATALSTSSSSSARKRITIGVTILIAVVILTTTILMVLFRCWYSKKIQERRSEEITVIVETNASPQSLLPRKSSIPNAYANISQSNCNFEQNNNNMNGTLDDGYSLLSMEQPLKLNVNDTDNPLDHDYEEPYFEPASEEEDIISQLRKMAIPVIAVDRLILSEYLGSGAFGTVHRGVWQHSEGDESVKEEVAVKSMEDGASEEERVKFLQEAAIMGQFNHPNIIRIIGFITDKPLKIALELMKKGDLRKHLIESRPNANEPVSLELPPTLLSYSRQVANGMMYLAVKCFVHRDLAARNVLVSEEGVCKIADFGLSRDLQKETYYKAHGGKIPVKWTAPEALHYHKYSTASDVWSYGCVLYEIWSLGYKPFHDVTNSEAMKRINAGFRLPPPPGCPKAIYDIMIKCWKPDASDRPGFLDIMVPIQKPDFQILKWSSEGVNSYSERARTLGAPLDVGHQLHRDLQRTYLTLESPEVSKEIVSSSKDEETNILTNDHYKQQSDINLTKIEDDNTSDGYA